MIRLKKEVEISTYEDRMLLGIERASESHSVPKGLIDAAIDVTLIDIKTHFAVGR